MGDSLELIGKRLLLLLDDGRPANGSETEQAVWARDWLRGTVRAVSVIGLAAPEVSEGGEATTTSTAAGLTVFVEFENASQRCSWVQVYDGGVKTVMFEDSIVWVTRSDGTRTTGAPTSASAWPALIFRSLVDKVGLGPLVPVEYFGNKNLEFLPDNKNIQRFEVDKDTRHPLLLEQPSLQAAISSWRADFELQEIFRKGSYTLQGRRVRVYQPEFEECWASGLVSHHDPKSHIMDITLDKGEENQRVDPRVIHVMLTDEEVGKNGRRAKDNELMKGDGGRRRRTPSEGEEDLNLKRFKGAGDCDTSSQISGDSCNAAGEGMWAGDSGERVSSTTRNGSSTEGIPPQVNTNPTSQMDTSNASSPRYPTHIKENGRLLTTQGAADSTSSLTPNPPPLKPAPSPFSTPSFPSLGHMPNLVPGAPAPKPSSSPQPEREEPCQSALSKTAALVSPGPVTISWSQDSSPSVALSAAVGFGPKAPSWGSQTEGSKTAPGFPLAQSVPAAPVFGDVTPQTNGAPATTAASQSAPRPFGFGFSGAKRESQPQQDQNLFFQCMNQNSGTSPALTPGQPSSKNPNYFTAVSGSLGKEPPGLFKPATSTEGLKMPEQPKVPEALSEGNGVFNKSSAFQGGAAGGHSLGVASGAQSAIKKNTNNDTSVGAIGLQSKFNSSDNHQNIFLQTSKASANPFLAYGDKTPHATFTGLTGTEPQTLGAALDSKPNLFSMAEPPKGMLSSTFPAHSAASSVSSSTPTPPQTIQSEASAMKKEQEVEEMPTSASGCPMLGTNGPGEMKEVPEAFDQSQKFSLEERGPSSKHESDSSSNSDLSDLSDNEEGPEKGQIPGERPGLDGAIQQKTKVQGAAKSRPRNKPFKVGQSVLKDQSKVRRLKQSGESFLQDGSCISVAPHLHKCRECRLERYRKYRTTDDDSDDEDDPNVACRFFHFRRLAFTRKGILRVEGFLSPQQSDAMAMGLWLPAPAVQEGLDLDTSKYILANVGDQFCQLVMSEKEAMMMVEPHQKVAWKRAVRGVREMCDVCETTLFNIHWVCRKCGFGVCLDCYRLRRNQPREDLDETPEDDVFSWLKCAKGQPHEPQNLMPTQIIPGTALYNIGDMVHAARGKWGIKANCPCASRHSKSLVRPTAPNGLSQQSTTSSGGSLAAAGSASSTTPKPEGETPVIKTEPSQAAMPSDSGDGETVGTTSSSVSSTSSTLSSSSSSSPPVLAASSPQPPTHPSSVSPPILNSSCSSSPRPPLLSVSTSPPPICGESLDLLREMFSRTQWPSPEEYSKLEGQTSLGRTDIVRWFKDHRSALKNGKTLDWMEGVQNTVGQQQNGPSSEKHKSVPSEVKAERAPWLVEKRGGNDATLQNSNQDKDHWLTNRLAHGVEDLRRTGPDQNSSSEAEKGRWIKVTVNVEEETEGGVERPRLGGDSDVLTVEQPGRDQSLFAEHLFISLKRKVPISSLRVDSDDTCVSVMVVDVRMPTGKLEMTQILGMRRTAPPEETADTPAGSKIRKVEVFEVDC
uniref:Lysine-specific demethylase n=2 Tax=Iconisemion striatum TaxID=60296 RepID=A0A1A7WDC0_9TELE